MSRAIGCCAHHFNEPEVAFDAPNGPIDAQTLCTALKPGTCLAIACAKPMESSIRM